MKPKGPVVLIVAAVLLATLSVLSLIPMPEVPDGPPPVVIYGTYVLGVIGLIAVVGLWLAKRWGMILTIIVSALSALSAAPGLVFAPTMELKVAAMVGVVLSIVLIVLVLLPSARKAYRHDAEQASIAR
ncbi:hypothetical protein KSF_011790 [Reticulibacter mediterranei]|uniref:Uncharacterized protein n=1 Tax=Reticulibacter mediterranei TaxID=2778369 RepID=A0A8J3IKA1_9CHLR|nr:hypothetical protein [Reticulibacter mediterranei]GHO91131.1 hypothetical protein KSF_011790 [Reticulibacter mediterranei]